MPYDYTPRQLETWDWPAQAAAWRMKAEHAHQETTYWKGVAAKLQARLTAGGEVPSPASNGVAATPTPTGSRPPTPPCAGADFCGDFSEFRGGL